MAIGATSTTEQTCTRCGLTKALVMFRPNKLMRSGADSWCKACVNAQRADKRKAIAGTAIIPSQKRCGGCGSIKCSDEFPRDKGSKDGLCRICKPCRSEKHKRALARYPERIAEQRRVASRRRISTPAGRIHHRIRARVYEWLGTKKGGKGTFQLLGYTLAELRQHLERQFLPGMSWENAGDWHVDHIVPLTAFAPESADDPVVRQAWALTNLRPLWAKDNIAKCDKRTHLI